MKYFGQLDPRPLAPALPPVSSSSLCELWEVQPPGVQPDRVLVFSGILSEGGAYLLTGEGRHKQVDGYIRNGYGGWTPMPRFYFEGCAPK